MILANSLIFLIRIVFLVLTVPLFLYFLFLLLLAPVSSLNLIIHITITVNISLHIDIDFLFHHILLFVWQTLILLVDLVLQILQIYFMTILYLHILNSYVFRRYQIVAFVL